MQIALTALADALSEGSETVTLTLGVGTGYTLGSPASASATLADKPSQAFFFAAISDSSKRGLTDDPDGDSSPNLVEYYFGSTPAGAASRGALTVVSANLSAGAFKVRYPRALNRTDVGGTLQWSSDLTTWRPGGQSDGVRTVTFSEAVVSANGADPETIEATATITGTASASRVFVRLLVQ